MILTFLRFIMIFTTCYFYVTYIYLENVALLPHIVHSIHYIYSGVNLSQSRLSVFIYYQFECLDEFWYHRIHVLSFVQTDIHTKSTCIFSFKSNRIPLIYNMNDGSLWTLYKRICFYKGVRLMQTFKKIN